MNDLDITILHLDQPGVRAALGDLEAEIMEAVWRRPADTGVTVREIWDEIYPKRAIMYTTVMNTMTRLARKRLLHSERAGQAFVYRAALSREEFVDHFVGEALERLLTNFGGAATARLRRVGNAAQRARLLRLLEAFEARRAGERQG